MSEIAVQIDENNRDVLYARRVEMLFEPNEDGTESVNGKVIWHTEWWHYSGTLLRGKSLGPRIERDVAAILDETYVVGDTPLPSLAVIAAIKSAFLTHAGQELGLNDEPEPDDA